MLRIYPTPEGSQYNLPLQFKHPIPTNEGGRSWLPEMNAPNTTMELENSGTILPMQRIHLHGEDEEEAEEGEEEEEEGATPEGKRGHSIFRKATRWIKQRYLRMSSSSCRIS